MPVAPRSSLCLGARACSGATGHPNERDHAMDLDEAIYGRRSVREYTSEAVDEEIIRRLIDAAVHAPSATNAQPWTFTVVRDQGLLDRVSEAAKTHLLADPAGWLSDRQRTRLADPAYHIFHHAPVLILISGTAPAPWVVENCALAAENLMLAAHGVGLGTCWIGYSQGYLNTPVGKDALGLPAEWVPVAPIIVGYPNAVPAPVARREPEVRWVR
jgi:nitroreductase